MPRKLHLVLWAVLVAWAVPCARAAGNDPVILRTDAFVAAPYDASTVLVFFSSSASIPANSGVSIGTAHGAARWVGLKPQLQVVRSGTESVWAARWPGGKSSAPKIGTQFVLALGGSTEVRGTLGTLGYLPLCDTTWLVGLISVDAVDRARFGMDNSEGFVAYAAPPRDSATPVQDEDAVAGPVILFSDNDAFGPARAKIETALQVHATADYANYMAQRQSIYESGRPSALVHVEGDAEMAAGKAQLSYTAQKISVGPNSQRYYVQALWKSSSGQTVYTISAWFTPEWELESITQSETPQHGNTESNGRILNLFTLTALPMLDQGDDSERNNIFLMEESGPEGMLYSLKRWTPGGVLPTGVYFANRCKASLP